MATSPKPVGDSPKGKQVHDVTYAKNLLQETFAYRGVKVAIGDAYSALLRRERALPKDVLEQRPRKWTERRVRALWSGREAKRVDHYEIEDLTAIAVEEARVERQLLRAREARLEALLASAVEGEHREGIHGSRGLAGGLDMSGAGRTDADPDYDQREYESREG